MMKKFDLWLVACLVVFSLLLTQFFILQAPDLANNIDGSWQYTLSGLRSSPQDLGTSIFYTYGPMFERIITYPTPHDSTLNYVVSSLFFVTLMSGSLYVLYRFLKLYGKKILSLKRYTLFFFGFLALTLPPIDSFFYIILLLGLLAIRSERGLGRKLLLIAAITPFALYKLSFSISFIFLLPFALIQLPLTFKKVWQLFIASAASLFVFILGFGITTFTLPTTFFRYLYYGLMNSVAYSEFMGLGFGDHKLITIIYTICFFGTAVVVALFFGYHIHKRDEFVSGEKLVSTLLFFAVGYFIFKQAVVRNDYGHILNFMPFIPLLLCALCVVAVMQWRKKATVDIPSPLFISCLVFGILLQITIVQTLSPSKSITGYFGKKATAIADIVTRNPLMYQSFRSQQKITQSSLSKKTNVTTGVRDYVTQNYVKSRGIVFFGNTTSLGDTFDEGRVVTYLPFVQNYAAFPPKLFDDVYIAELKKHPDDLVFLEEIEPSINERIPSHELNNFFQYVKHNYKVIYSDPEQRQYLLEPVSQHMEQCSLLHTIETQKGLAFTIPDITGTDTEYLKMKVQELSGINETILGLVLKKPVYSIELITPEGSGTKRTTQSTLQHGVAISPFYFSYTDVIKKTPVPLRAVAIHGGIEKNKKINVEFELCRFQ